MPATKPETRSNDRSVTGGFWGMLRGQNSKSGEVVNVRTAQGVTAVWACIRVISETLSTLSSGVYVDTDNGKQRLRSHPVARLLKNPHPLYNGQLWMETMAAWASLTGNAYSVIIRDGSGIPRQIRHVTNDQVTCDYDSGLGLLLYTVYDSKTGKAMVVDQGDMIHFRATVWDMENGRGKSPIEAHRDTLGLAIAGNGYMSSLMKNGANLSGILTTDNTLTNDQVRANRDSWQATYGGTAASGRTAVLQGGMKYQQLTLSPADAQWLQVMKATVEDVSRIFRVPMHMLSALERSTNNNIEHQGREFVTHTIRPWAKRIEAEMMKLFSDRSSAYFRFDLNSLLRGDTKARAAMYDTMSKWGHMNSDEIRNLEGYNAKPNGEGQSFLYPVNMAPWEVLSNPNTPNPASDGSEEE